jgi:uncharacterized RDD family membrane protein YckC
MDGAMPIDAEYRLEIPENVEVSYDLAGPGSRFCALLIDTLLMWLMIFVLVIAALIADAGWLSALDRAIEPPGDPAAAWIQALIVVAVALVVFGYYTFFEIMLRGQTPGKRSLKLRVIRDDGTPADALGIVIRNLVRVVDCLPGFYAVGGLVSLFSTTHKRLGDLAAGTIVVKESEADYRAQADRKKTAAPSEVAIPNAALAPEEQRLIRGFLQRRDELLHDARQALADRLASHLFEKYGGHFGDAESYLERLSQERHYEP